MDALLEAVKFNEKGLVGVIIQDYESKQVLMMAWMNRQALELTISEKRAWYFSRSRNKLWLKGETSGNIQKVRSIRLDCDGDAILLEVDQIGGACHTGYRSCFYRIEENGAWKEDGEKVFDADAVYKK